MEPRFRPADDPSEKGETMTDLQKQLTTHFKRSKSAWTIHELAEKFVVSGTKKDQAWCDSQIRNTLRPLKAAKLIKKVGRGTYRAR